jgi:hypothetical protein
VAFAQSSQIVSRHGVDAANRDCADRCRRKQAQCEIFHRKSPFVQAKTATIVFDLNLCCGLHLANATPTSLFPLDQAIEQEIFEGSSEEEVSNWINADGQRWLEERRQNAAPE